MKHIVLLMSILASASFASAATDTITCTLKSVLDTDEAKSVLIATDTKAASPYGVNLWGESADGKMSFDVSLGRTTSVIISDLATNQLTTVYFKAPVYEGHGTLVQLAAHNTSKGEVVLACQRDE